MENSLSIPHPPMADIVILAAAAVCIVALFRSLRLSPVLGYLVAGAMIGPYGIGVIKNVATTQGIAELGVVFLLFMIGQELSLARLKAMRVEVFGIGTAQLLITSLVIGGLAVWQNQALASTVVIAGGLALSSTALVLQVIEESGEKSSQVGRLSLAILLLQDLAVMPLLVLMPLLANEITGVALVTALGEATLKAMVALAVIIILGRLLLRPLYRFVAALNSAELFSATTLLVVFGTSFLTEQAGLSMALGAFVAGLLVAETEYSHQIEADVKPYKGLLMGLFFMTVGMRLDLEMLISGWKLLALMSIALIVIKSGIIFLLLRLSGIGKCSATHTALLLAQGGEFGFILFSLAVAMEIMPQSVGQHLLVVVTITMALTPLLAGLGKIAARRLRQNPSVGPDNVAQQTLDLSNHVVVAGYGRMGQLICDILREEGVAFIAIEQNPIYVNRGRTNNIPVFYGDAERTDVLESAGVSRARASIVTFGDEKRAAIVVKQLRSSYPALPILVRTLDMQQAKTMEKLGANVAVPEVFEGSLQIASALLKLLDVPDHEITRVTDRYREEEYDASMAKSA